MNRIGERMSEFTDLSHIVELPNGDLFLDQINFIIGKPLSIGQLLYAKLRRELPEDIEVEVIWNHFSDLITATIAGRNVEFLVTFKDMQMARVDKVERINHLVEATKEAIPSHS